MVVRGTASPCLVSSSADLTSHVISEAVEPPYAPWPATLTRLPGRGEEWAVEPENHRSGFLKEQAGRHCGPGVRVTTLSVAYSPLAAFSAGRALVTSKSKAQLRLAQASSAVRADGVDLRAADRRTAPARRTPRQLALLSAYGQDEVLIAHRLMDHREGDCLSAKPSVDLTDLTCDDTARTGRLAMALTPT